MFPLCSELNRNKNVSYLSGMYYFLLSNKSFKTDDFLMSSNSEIIRMNINVC